MGITKTETYTDQTLALASTFKALGHPARIAILQYISAQTTCICGDIVAELPLSQASISRHLQELKAAGLIKGEISGTSVCYCINDTQFPFLDAFIKQIQVSNTTTCCP
jgi:DNA-binding transcriptional ArsR family regulator